MGWLPDFILASILLLIVWSAISYVIHCHFYRKNQEIQRNSGITESELEHLRNHHYYNVVGHVMSPDFLKKWADTALEYPEVHNEVRENLWYLSCVLTLIPFCLWETFLTFFIRSYDKERVTLVLRDTTKSVFNSVASLYPGLVEAMAESEESMLYTTPSGDTFYCLNIPLNTLEMNSWRLQEIQNRLEEIGSGLVYHPHFPSNGIPERLKRIHPGIEVEQENMLKRIYAWSRGLD